MKIALALFVFSMLGVIVYLYYILIRDSYDANKKKVSEIEGSKEKR